MTSLYKHFVAAVHEHLPSVPCQNWAALPAPGLYVPGLPRTCILTRAESGSRLTVPGEQASVSVDLRPGDVLNAATIERARLRSGGRPADEDDNDLLDAYYQPSREPLVGPGLNFFFLYLSILGAEGGMRYGQAAVFYRQQVYPASFQEEETPESQACFLRLSHPTSAPERLRELLNEPA